MWTSYLDMKLTKVFCLGYPAPGPFMEEEEASCARRLF